MLKKLGIKQIKFVIKAVKDCRDTDTPWDVILWDNSNDVLRNILQENKEEIKKHAKEQVKH